MLNGYGGGYSSNGLNSMSGMGGMSGMGYNDGYIDTQSMLDQQYGMLPRADTMHDPHDNLFMSYSPENPPQMMQLPSRNNVSSLDLPEMTDSPIMRNLNAPNARLESLKELLRLRLSVEERKLRLQLQHVRQLQEIHRIPQMSYGDGLDMGRKRKGVKMLACAACYRSKVTPINQCMSCIYVLLCALCWIYVYQAFFIVAVQASFAIYNTFGSVFSCFFILFFRFLAACYFSPKKTGPETANYSPKRAK